VVPPEGQQFSVTYRAVHITHTTTAKSKLLYSVFDIRVVSDLTRRRDAKTHRFALIQMQQHGLRGTVRGKIHERDTARTSVTAIRPLTGAQRFSDSPSLPRHPVGGRSHAVFSVLTLFPPRPPCTRKRQKAATSAVD
jgi:hypothetical protein